jgi:uncharacterized protein (DUF1499 family)
MRILFLLVALVAAMTVAAAIYFRMAPMTTAQWHVDPATATPPATPNFALRQGDDAALIPAPVDQVARALSAHADRSGAQLLAGDLQGDFATYVVRSRLMGYPDAISLRLTAQDDATRVEIFSRSRFGQSDLGVNAARVAQWINAATP